MGDVQRKGVLYTLPLHVSCLTMPLVPACPSLDGGGKLKNDDPPLIYGSLNGS